MAIDAYSKGSKPTSHDTTLANLEHQMKELAPSVVAWTKWCAAYQPELDRLDTLERHIDLTRRLDRVAAKAVERSAERDLGRGIEL